MNYSRKSYILLGDAISLVVSFFVMIALGFPGLDKEEVINLHQGPFIIISILWLIVFFVFNLYDQKNLRPTPASIGYLGFATFLGTMLGAGLFYLFPSFGISPKVNLLIFSASSFFLIIIWRRIFFRIFEKSLVQKIAILGKNQRSQEMISELKNYSYLGKIVGEFETTEALANFCQKNKVDFIVIVEDIKEDIVKTLNDINLPVLRLKDAYEEIFSKTSIDLMTNEDAISILEKKDLGRNFLYRILEVLFSVLILTVTLPITVLFGIFIFLEDGAPVFYKQDRVGKGGKNFKVIKFRSMTKNAESAGAMWAEKKDPRVTKVGKVIRKLHVDEIPQMINIIKGDIALVGPRPERPEFVEKLKEEIPYYYIRHAIKPGFTGWAQIKYRYARSVLDSKEKFEYDLYYLKNKSFLLDLGIILKTIQIIFTH
ncbi:MAG: sugar transferase [Candidatus Nomurabacteria bacterium]|nr:MAG: sugar transferase [Candidatus Nomurabacteria bacterium]